MSKKAEKHVTAAMEAFAAGEIDKWDAYTTVFALLERGRVTLTFIKKASEKAGAASAGVVAMRRAQFLGMRQRGQPARGKTSEYGRYLDTHPEYIWTPGGES